MPSAQVGKALGFEDVEHVRVKLEEVPEHIRSDGVGRGNCKLLMLINAVQRFDWTDIPQQHSKGLSPAHSQ